jgi:hypothetical protein
MLDLADDMVDDKKHINFGLWAAISAIRKNISSFEKLGIYDSKCLVIMTIGI